MIRPIPTSRRVSIRKGRSIGPLASCSATVRSRFSFGKTPTFFPIESSPRTWPEQVYTTGYRAATLKKASRQHSRVTPEKTKKSFFSLQPPISKW